MTTEHVLHLSTEEVRLLRQHAHLSMTRHEKGHTEADRYWLPIARSAYEKLREAVDDADPATGETPERHDA